jgi:outer membrane murein-binding lipoprotein Lpp
MANLEAKIQALETEIRELRSESRVLQKQVERLKGLLDQRAAKKDKNVVHEELDHLEQSLLSYLASVRRKDCTTKKIADGMRAVHPASKMTELKAKVYLERLAKRDLVGQTLDMGGGPSSWRLNSRGEEYVVVHDLETSGVEEDEPDATDIGMMKMIGGRKSLTASDLGETMQLHSVLVEHHLRRLLNGKFVEGHQVPMLGMMYSLSDKGNAYLVENKLVPLPNQPRSS